MQHFGKAVVKYKIPILIAALVLLVPSVFGMLNTRINYDMLDYLPGDMDTVVGQNILKDDFGKGAFSLVVIEGMDDKDVSALTSQIREVPHVVDALWYDSIGGAGVPKEVIPEKYYDAFNDGDATMVAVFFDSGTSSDDTMQAVSDIRQITDKQVYVSGMSALVTDLKNIAEREEPLYVAVAVGCALVALLLLTDSWLAPFIFLASIGMAILYNLGSNFFLGDISYITKALAAVLQLAVTMDYSIFLWHSFTEKQRLYPGDNNAAMAEAISDTLIAIFSSALTASAGFLALCFMSYTLGADLGIVMAKGCLLGLLASVTILPGLMLVFEKGLEKTRHRALIPKADRLASFVTSKYWVLLIVFVLVPAGWGFMNKPIFYDFTNLLTGQDSQLPDEDIQFHIADEKVQEHFDVATTEMILCKADLSHIDAKEMLDRIDAVDGVRYAIGYDSVRGGAIPDEAIPVEAKSALKSGDWQLMLVNSSYLPSTDEVNAQIDEINSIVKNYDADAMLIGEAPATKDLISVTDHDFMVVDLIAIAAILVILLIVFKSISLPVILVCVIEFAIFINLGIPYYTGAAMVFITPVCISTIQLGSTVNYAILMTTRYRKERHEGQEKHAAISTALATSLPSIITSAVSFFAATIGVAVYSNMGIISQMCMLMARGAVVSMFAVLFVLPALFVLCDKVICKTSKGFIPEEDSDGRGRKGPRLINKLKEAHI